MTARPNVLLIGDSISMGYGPHVADLLAAEAQVAHNPGNAGDTANTAANLDGWLGRLPADVIHFNCGLHDIKVSRRTHTHQVPLDQYRENLGRIVGRLKRTGATLVWASTTPVVDGRHEAGRDFDRYNRDVDIYNAAAAEIVAEAGIPMNDLHAAATAAGIETIITPDGVHFTDEGCRILGTVVADCLRRHLRG